MTSITLLYGQWSPNIGNAFFNVGGAWLIKQAWPDARLTYMSDVAGHMLPWRTQKEKGNPKNDANALARVQADAVVLQGPMLNRGFASLYGPALRTLKANGTKILLISAGMNKYDKEEEEVSKKFLDEIRPHILLTRDRPTFDIFKDYAPNVHCGIDSAFFCPDAYTPPVLRGPYISLSCDQTLEPDLVPADSTGEGQLVEVGDLRLRVVSRKGFAARLRKGNLATKALSWALPRDLPTSILGHDIIRPFHKVNPFVSAWIYQSPGTHASDEPYGYLNIYANTTVTITDRVHAGIVSLAYGKPVLFLGSTKRAHLFDRVCSDVNKGRLARIDQAALDKEKHAEIGFLSGVKL